MGRDVDGVLAALEETRIDEANKTDSMKGSQAISSVNEVIT
jgi:hypothetical protein